MYMFGRAQTEKSYNSGLKAKQESHKPKPPCTVQFMALLKGTDEEIETDPNFHCREPKLTGKE